MLVIPSGTRADQTSSASGFSDPGSPLTNLYVGLRVGAMPVRLDSGKLDQGLTSLGFGSVSASTDTSAFGGTAYLGYEFTPPHGG